MADITITATSVVAGTDADIYQGVAGETTTAGQAVYLDYLTNRLFLADANASEGAAEVKGVALHGASAGQPLRVQTAGGITIGGTTVESTIYIASGTAGGIAPAVDLASGWYTTVIGVGGLTNTLKLSVFPSRSKKA